MMKKSRFEFLNDRNYLTMKLKSPFKNESFGKTAKSSLYLFLPVGNREWFVLKQKSTSIEKKREFLVLFMNEFIMKILLTSIS